MSEDKNFVDMCAICKQGVSKSFMTYKNGRVFHPLCFEYRGDLFPPVNTELVQLSARTRIKLVQMKNLMARSDGKETKQKTKSAQIRKNTKTRQKRSKSKRPKTRPNKKQR